MSTAPQGNPLDGLGAEPPSDSDVVTPNVEATAVEHSQVGDASLEGPVGSAAAPAPQPSHAEVAADEHAKPSDASLDEPEGRVDASAQEPNPDEVQASDRQDAPPSVEVMPDGHLQVGFTLGSGMEEQADPAPHAVNEAEPTADDIRCELEDLQRQLARGHGMAESDGPDRGSVTIANTAADVKQINVELEELQERLALAYPMTDEEKASCQLRCSFSDRSRTEHNSNRVDADAADRGTELSLADACSVLLGVARHGAARGQKHCPTTDPFLDGHSPTHSMDVIPPSRPDAWKQELVNIERFTSARPPGSDAEARLASPSLATGGAAAPSRPYVNRGVELRKATHVLKRRLHGNGESR